VAVPPDEYLRGPAGVRGALSVDSCFQDEVASDNRDVSEVLHFGMREFETDEFPAAVMELDCGLDDFGLVLPLRLAGADDDGSGGHELLKSRLKAEGA
jgi:hypothetical protein